MAAIPVPTKSMLVGSGLVSVGIDPEELSRANEPPEPPKREPPAPPKPKRLPRPKKAKPPPPPQPATKGSTAIHNALMNVVLNCRIQLQLPSIEFLLQIPHAFWI